MELDQTELLRTLNGVDTQSFILPRNLTPESITSTLNSISFFVDGLSWLDEFNIKVIHYGDSKTGSLLNWVLLKRKDHSEKVLVIYFSRFGGFVTVEVYDEVVSECFFPKIVRSLIDKDSFFYIDYDLINSLPYSGKYDFQEMTWNDRFFCEMSDLFC